MSISICLYIVRIQTCHLMNRGQSLVHVWYTIKRLVCLNIRFIDRQCFDQKAGLPQYQVHRLKVLRSKYWFASISGSSTDSASIKMLVCLNIRFIDRQRFDQKVGLPQYQVHRQTVLRPKGLFASVSDSSTDSAPIKRLVCLNIRFIDRQYFDQKVGLPQYQINPQTAFRSKG